MSYYPIFASLIYKSLSINLVTHLIIMTADSLIQRSKKS